MFKYKVQSYKGDHIKDQKPSKPLEEEGPGRETSFRERETERIDEEEEDEKGERKGQNKNLKTK